VRRGVWGAEGVGGRWKVVVCCALEGVGVQWVDRSWRAIERRDTRRGTSLDDYGIKGVSNLWNSAGVDFTHQVVHRRYMKALTHNAIHKSARRNLTP
jgi:hypothetical protein